MFILLYIFFMNLKFGNISEALFWIQRGDFLLRNTWKDYSGRGYVLSRLSSFVYGYTLISHYFTQVTRIVNANAVGKSTTMLIVGLEIADCCQKAPLNLSVCYNMTLLLPPTPPPHLRRPEHYYISIVLLGSNLSAQDMHEIYFSRNTFWTLTLS